MRLLLLIGLTSVVVAAAASATTSPRMLYASAIAHARAQRSVQYTASTKAPGVAFVVTGAAGRSAGVQYVTMSAGGQTGHVEVRVIGNTAYAKGDAFTLPNYLQLSPKFAGEWVYFTAPSSGYRQVAHSVTLGSFVDQLTFRGPYIGVPHGVRSDAKQDNSPATTIMLVDAKTLPVKETVKSPAGDVSVSTTMSRWNEKVTVTAPPGAIAVN
jgi:hypothetical protein